MTLTAGTRLGNYEVIDLLGAGSMGEVYRARDTLLGRDVALKVLPSHVADNEERLERFQREARLLASLGASSASTPRNPSLARRSSRSCSTGTKS
jgi:serine/threonine protein kinase